MRTPSAVNRIGLGCLALLLSLTLGCQESTPSTELPEPAPSLEVTPLDHLPALRGDYFELASEEVGRSFHIYVRFPEGYESPEVSEDEPAGDSPDDTRYPVVYLLDGDSLFPILAANHLFLAYDDGLPEAVVVGIAYGSFERPINQRGHDFSAPADDAEEWQGGAPAFHAFLENELLPTVEERYRVDPSRRVLFGQSRGGHFVLWSAFEHPDVFWGRIASNPSFTPGRERFFAPPAAAIRDDLNLVVTSGTDDRPQYREGAVAFADAWREVGDLPWSLEVVTLDGGTHAADSARSYRAGMRRFFGLEDPPS
ncbi:MAG: alpha/beta hydrolase-fold protein [Acidobacteriota bacterium]